MNEIIATYFDKVLIEINVWLKSRKNIIQNTAKIILVVILALISANPISSWYIFLRIANWQGAIIPWIFNYYFIVFWLYPEIKKAYKSDFHTESQIFFGISIDNLVDFIMENWTFKTDEIMRQFSISRNIVNQMLDRIDETEIFIRWKNNARILNISLTKSEIIQLLLSEKSNEESDENESSESEESDENETWFFQHKIIESSEEIEEIEAEIA